MKNPKLNICVIINRTQFKTETEAYNSGEGRRAVVIRVTSEKLTKDDVVCTPIPLADDDDIVADFDKDIFRIERLEVVGGNIGTIEVSFHFHELLYNNEQPKGDITCH